MINSIIEAISRAIKTEFGSGYTNYMEEIRQDLKEPCFFISCINPAGKLIRGGKYSRTHQFCIQYFPNRGRNERRECNDVAERLMVCLEYLRVGEQLMRGTQMNGEQADGILNFFVNYDTFVYKEPEELPIMEEVSEDISVKG